LLLDRFLAESTTYAESVVDTEDLEAIEFKQNPTSTISEEDEGSDSESTRISDDLDELRLPPEIQPRHSIGQASILPIQEKLPVSPVQIPVSSSGGTPVSNRPQVSRAITKRWAEAKQIRYGGDDWSDEDDEYYESTSSPARDGQQSSWPAQIALSRQDGAQPLISGAHFQPSSDGLPDVPPIAPQRVEALSDSIRKKLKEREPHLELDHEAIKGAKTARERLSQSERRRLDNRLLLLLEGNQNSSKAIPGRNWYRPEKVGTLSQVRDVLDHGADPIAQIAPDAMLRTSRGDAALIVEILNARRIEVIRLLFSRGADVNAQAEHHGNALTCAVRQDKTEQSTLELAKILLDYGADVNAQRGYYGNALQAAACDGKVQLVELLLDYGADVNAQGGFWDSALQAASDRHHPHVVGLLLEHGADVNARGGHRGSALQAALKNSDYSSPNKTATVKLLREHGATEG
jgi:ankyrin repeat protein